MIARRLSLGVLFLAGCNACNEPSPRPPAGPRTTSGGTTTAAVPPSQTAPPPGTAPTATGTGGPPASTFKHWVMGYYGGYQTELLPVGSVDYSSLSHLAVSRVVPRADGTLDVSFDSKSGLEMSQHLVTAAHVAGRKAILMVGGDGAHDGYVAAVAKDPARLVDSVVRVVKAHGYDGVDIDWEPIPTADEPKILALLDALRKALPNAILTMPVAWDKIPKGASQIAARLDQMNIMSYGMTGAWPGWKTWHSSALYGTLSSVDKSVSGYLAAGVPPQKLGVGVGFYGTCWSGATAPNQDLGAGFKVITSDNDISYTNIVYTYTPLGRPLWDDAAKAPYLTFPKASGPKGCSYITYEDERSLLEKAEYVKKKGLGGVIIWTINQGVVGNQQPLAAALKKSLLQ